MEFIRSISLPNSFNGYTNKNNENLSRLEPVSRINILVGANNSGKSRFMRTLSSQKEYRVTVENIDLESVNSRITSYLDNIIETFDRTRFDSVNQLNISFIKSMKDLPKTLVLSQDAYSKHRSAFEQWSDFPAVSQWSGGGRGDTEEVREAIKRNAAKALETLLEVPTRADVDAPQRVYIPTLRGLRPVSNTTTDLYQERTSKDYFAINEDSLSSPEIFTGLGFSDRLTKMLLGTNSDRKSIGKYQDFISNNLFEGRQVQLIPNLETRDVIVKIGNEAEQPIYHLGDGIQSAIILSFLPFVMDEPTFFFIEEPEMFMHPGLQRKIVKFFAARPQHTFFLTTHSNHFLDITIDIKEISIFTFQKQFSQDDGSDEQIPTFSIEAVDSGHISSLELLGVRNSSVFLVNATIWLEGITDRWYIRTMLTSYMEYLQQQGQLPLLLEEDTHYSFVEYGGANITHWSFLDNEEHPIEVERLCAKAIVLIDSDGDKKLERKEKLRKILKDRLVILPAMEVENLLPYDVIKQVVLEFEKTPDRKLPSIAYTTYKDKKLGTFIEDRILKKDFERKGGYRAESGTIKSKVEFCERALPKINYAELPEETQTIIQQIYEFVKSQNVE